MTQKAVKPATDAKWPGNDADNAAKILGTLSEQAIVELHKSMDHDNSGSCDLEEFESELAKRGVNTKDAAISRLLMDADLDGDGEISLEELLELCKKVGSK